ncbi:MAG: MFS transporter [Bacteroidales bacterium]|nr:MFS transporter [Bacteroidales bacterium]
MSNKKTAIIPVLFAFIIMGFGDMTGILQNHIKEDFALSETVAGIIPMAIYIWFLFLSAPTALFMNKAGRKTAVQVSNVVTFLGMLIPLISYNIVTCLIACAMIGIGNTIIQVALNPLLSDAAGGKGSLSSYISAGQVLKALSACSAPFLALWCANMFGSWKYVFPIFAILTLISSIWLLCTRIEETPAAGGTSLVETFKLLGNGYIFCCFMGIFTVVGLDVGANVITPKLLMERCGMDIDHAQLGISLYFICKTAGAFVGAFALTKVADRKFFMIAISIVALALAGLFFAQGRILILVLLGLIGFFSASVFSIIISLGINYMPSKSNEISGLMIMGIVGGGVVTLLMGLTADKLGSQTGSLAIIALCVAYLALCAFVLLKPKAKA